MVNEGSPAVELFGVMVFRIGVGLALPPSSTFFLQELENKNNKTSKLRLNLVIWYIEMLYKDNIDITSLINFLKKEFTVFANSN